MSVDGFECCATKAIQCLSCGETFQAFIFVNGDTEEIIIYGRRCPGCQAPSDEVVSLGDVQAERTSNGVSPMSTALDHDAALDLDGQIQAVAGKTGEHLDYLSALLLEAKAGEIHKLLGFPSWTAYLIERLRPIAVALNVQDRRTLVDQLHRHGMSVRAVAEAVGMSRSTVWRQVSQCVTGAEPCNGEGVEESITGLDGKGYHRRGGGGYRGKMPPAMRLSRYRSGIDNLAGLPEEAESLKERICEEIDELILIVNGRQLVNLDG